MINLESSERGTPEFQRLTSKQQNERRKSFSLALGNIFAQSSSLGITERQAAQSAGDILELHLTGKIERVREEPPKKRRK